MNIKVKLLAGFLGSDNRRALNHPSIKWLPVQSQALLFFSARADRSPIPCLFPCGGVI